MKLKHILLALIPCIMALACKKEDVLLYDGEESGIYFQAGYVSDVVHKRELYSDSAVFSFSNVPNDTMETILNMARVRTMGKVKDYPRPVKFSVDQAKSTAVEGKHYEIYLNSVVIPAGAGEAYIPVKFKRTADMLNKTFELVLKLEENEHFKIYMEKQRNTNLYGSGTDISADIFKFIVGEIYTIPDFYEFFFLKFWGPWTATKFKFINSVLGWTHYDWTTRHLPSSPVKLGAMDPAALKVRDALQALADAGTPMFDEDGSKMQLGPNYLVRY